MFSQLLRKSGSRLSRNLSICGLFISGLVFQIGCVGSGSYTHFDKDQDVVEVQSSGDSQSALPDLKSRGEIQNAISNLLSTTKSNPKDVKALLNLARLYLASNQFDKSIAVVRKALRYDLKSRPAKKILAQIYLRTGNYDMATIILNGLGGSVAKDPDVINMMATIALFEERKSDALQLYRKGLDLDPNNVSLRMNLGVLLVKFRQFPKAAIQFERVLKIIPEHNDAKLHLAIIKSSVGYLEESEEIYNTILARKSNNPIALYNLATLELKRKRFREAGDLLKQYLNSSYAQNNSNDEIYSLLEEIDIRQKRNAGLSDEEARSIAERMKTDPNGAKASVARGVGSESDTTAIDADIKALQQQLE